MSCKTIFIKCQRLYSGINKNNINSLSSAELALRVVKVNYNIFVCFFSSFLFSERQVLVNGVDSVQSQHVLSVSYQALPNIHQFVPSTGSKANLFLVLDEYSMVKCIVKSSSLNFRTLVL